MRDESLEWFNILDNLEAFVEPVPEYCEDDKLNYESQI